MPGLPSVEIGPFVLLSGIMAREEQSDTKNNVYKKNTHLNESGLIQMIMKGLSTCHKWVYDELSETVHEKERNYNPFVIGASFFQVNCFVQTSLSFKIKKNRLIIQTLLHTCACKPLLIRDLTRSMFN